MAEPTQSGPDRPRPAGGREAGIGYRDRGRWRAAALGAVLLLAACHHGAGSAESNDGLTGGHLVFEDHFDGPQLTAHWSSPSEAWTVQDGALHVANAQNSALWLDVTLPEQVRVEFDATAEASDGDLKFEIFGDGVNHQSGYIVIYGGWHNTVTCIARLNEHGDDRLDAPTHHPVEPGHTYHFAAVRTDQRVRFYIDGQLVLSYDDAEPLRGDDHSYFAFNDWTAPEHFDNLQIYDLSD